MVLNLCLDDEAARLMGVENHVCEVQIVLAALAEAQQVDPSRSSLALRLCPRGGLHIILYFRGDGAGYNLRGEYYC